MAWSFSISFFLFVFSSIDCFGDHLLGCSHGPMRIRRHDALVSILHHALLQDHPGALKEQRASFDDNSRPRDIFFIQIFRMVVQPISMSLSAALLSPLIYPPLLHVLGWLLRLERWLRVQSTWLCMVEKAGGDFIPWNILEYGHLFALSTLNSIADRMITRSGISRKLARNTYYSNFLYLFG